MPKAPFVGFNSGTRDFGVDGGVTRSTSIGFLPFGLRSGSDSIGGGTESVVMEPFSGRLLSLGFGGWKFFGGGSSVIGFSPSGILRLLSLFTFGSRVVILVVGFWFLRSILSPSSSLGSDFSLGFLFGCDGCGVELEGDVESSGSG